MMFDVRKSYEIIKWITEDEMITREQKLRITKDIKADLRKVLKPLDTDPFKETYHYRDEYGESYYIKEFFDIPFTEEEKEEFIENHWRHLNCPYDCTGLSFTQRIAICNFKEPNSFGARSVVYHFLGLDV